MRKLFILWFSALAFITISAQDYYTKQWKIVKESYEKGEKKSLLPTIYQIQKQAMKDKNTVQIIKSLKEEYILSGFEEDEKNNQVSRFYSKLDSVEAKLKGKDKALFYFFKGKFVNEYFEPNQWRISNRTKLENQNITEIESWTTLDFKNYLLNYYKILHEKSKDLKTFKIDSAKEIVDVSDVTLPYYQTFYDWALNNEIVFLQNPALFTPDELKQNKKKIKDLYSILINDNTNPNAKLLYNKELLDLNGEVYSDKKMIQPYEKLYNEAPNVDYKLDLASFIAEKYIYFKEEKKAYDFIQAAKKQVPSSVFMPNLLEVENQLTEKHFSPRLNEAIQANRSIPLSVSYRNMEDISFNIYAISPDDKELLPYLWDSRNLDKLQKKLIRKVDFKLKNSNDFKDHLTVLEIEPLPKGLYLLEYPSANKEIDYTLVFTVNESKIILGKTNLEDEENILRLIENETGVPLTNKVLKLSYFDGKKNIEGNVVTDKNGEFSLPSNFGNTYYQKLLVEDKSTGNINIISDSDFNSKRYYDGEEEEKRKIQIFTDRSIYRPGQIVYFKAITTERKGETFVVMANRSQTIILRDANNNELNSQKLITNDFGSLNGQFVLPTGKLNGEFSIKLVDDLDKNQSEIQYFQVEEYKRPQFEITFDPIQGDYKLGDKTVLKGSVSSFSGLPLANTLLDYEVLKTDIRRQYFSSRFQNNSYNSAIGTVTTDKDGKFAIEVDLEKEKAIKSGIQIFGFEVIAKLTDSNGETQSARTSIKAASTSYYFTSQPIGDVLSDEEINAKVAVKNYSEQNVNKNYHLKLSKYEGDERIIISTFDSSIQTDPYYSKSDFVKKFPHLEFDKKDKIYNNSKQLVFDKAQTTKSVNLGKLSAGNYELEWYNIEGNDTIKTVQNFSVFSKSGLEKNQKPFINVVYPKNELKVNDKATFYIYSAVPNAQVEIIYQQDDNTETHEFKALKNGVLVYQKLVPAHCKMFNIQFRIAALNHVQTKGRSFEISADNAELKINLVTFRDKMEPNQKEQWKAYISGKEKEKVNAEVLATMYDKSLDKFKNHAIKWNLNDNYVFRFVSFSSFPKFETLYFTESRNYQDPVYVYPPYFKWSNGGEIVYEAYNIVEPLSAKVSGVLIREDAVVTGAMGVKKESSLNAADKVSNEENDKTDEVKVRENLNETAFFYPSLKTDENGDVYFEFTSPEGLTKWKLSLLAHTKDARAGVLEQDVITQKEFSVAPNYPRFFREGDEMVFKSKISSLVDKVILGSAQLQILDALTNEDVTSQFGFEVKNQSFSIQEKGSTTVAWKLKVPQNLSSVIIKVVAKAGQYSDGEQKAVAVLPNRILVTDTQPIFVKEGETKTIVLESLKNNSSKTVQNVSNTLELTTNPIWEVLFALPSLKNESEVSADAVFNKWFADVAASEIFKANPKLKSVFEKYQQSENLTSNLEKNQELKQLLLEETPWVLDSQNEAKQMQQIARLFDANNMKQSITTDWTELLALQNADGGFSWYNGYPSSYNVSIYILNQLGKITQWIGEDVKYYRSNSTQDMLTKLIDYVDSEGLKLWSKKEKIGTSNHLIDYLYTRHFWTKSFPLNKTAESLKKQFVEEAPKIPLNDYTFFGLHRAALLYHDFGLSNLSTKLLTYLKETATDSKTQGVYWKANLDGWGWYQSKIVNHAGAIEAFSILEPKNNSWIEDLKIWLVTQKEVSAWSNSKSTAEVIFQILNSGKSWTTNEADKVEVKWGNKKTNEANNTPGYTKLMEKSDKIDKNLGAVTISKSGPGLVQGGLYWQYFENLDQVKSTENYLSIRKELYKKIRTVNGEELKKISEQDPLKVGDRVTVRLLLNTDRTMEFMHIKDMRAAGFEPTNVLSGYVWQNNLGYYQSTKDASTNFYIQYMPKGQYVLEYDVFCNAEGHFSNGVTTLQNYYAPQMNARTAGEIVEIK